MQIQSARFKALATEKLADANLFRALSNLRGLMVAGRAKVILELDNFEETREAARQARDSALEHLDFLLEEFERNATARGAKVHWAEDSQQMNQLVLDIARRANVRKVIKSKSMLGEESGLNHFLQQGGIEVRETDLGEYIIQESGDTPSHIIGPAIHKTREEVSDLFEERHKLPRKTDIAEMTREAREILRPHFLTADMGITGANFLVARDRYHHDRDQRGQWPHDHHAAARARSDRRHREGAADAGGRVLHSAPAHALGHRTVHQQLPHVYHRQQACGRPGRPRGVPHHHRRRGAHACPRLGAAGGPALHPLRRVHEPLPGVPEHRRTPVWVGVSGADRLGTDTRLPRPGEGAGSSERRDAMQPVRRGVPVKIPLPDLMRKLRERQFERKLRPRSERFAIKLWAWAAAHPRVYGLGARIAARLGKWLGGRDGMLHHLPGAGSAWTAERDFPAPAGKTFRELYAARRAANAEPR